MDWDTKTIKTYDDSAVELTKYFAGIGPRVDDIQLALQLSGSNGDAKVIEIGCGDGRDAAEITKRVAEYTGIDPSEGLLKIARRKLPETKFVQSDALSYHYPKDVDVIYAFASLLHVNKDDLRIALEKSSESLRPGGIYYISLKERKSYSEELKSDQFGERAFYHYNPSIIKELSAPWFDVVNEAHQRIGHTDWFTIALRRHSG